MKKKCIITIGREYGSRGREIGEKCAALLGLQFYDKEVVELAAAKSGLDPKVFEKVDEKKNFSLQGGAFGLRTSIIDSINSNYLLSNESLFVMQSEIIREVGKEGGAVIVGRCADYVLKDNPDLLSVFIVAEKEDRVERVALRESISLDEAALLIEKTDKNRSSYYNYFTNKRWGHPHSYHLCLNSTTLGVDCIVQLIADAVTFKKC